MPFKSLDAGLHVAPQITEQDIAAAADAGIKTIINVRPDGEQATAMTSADARALAEARGLAYHHLPVTPTGIADEHVQGFRDLLDSAEGPVLAHCGSGLRAAVLWALYLGFAKVPRKAKRELAERRTLAERKVPLPVTEEILGLRSG